MVEMLEAWGGMAGYSVEFEAAFHFAEIVASLLISEGFLAIRIGLATDVLMEFFVGVGDILAEIVEVILFEFGQQAFDHDVFSIDPGLTPVGMARDLARVLEEGLPEGDGSLGEAQVDVAQMRAHGRFDRHLLFQPDDLDVNEVDVHRGHAAQKEGGRQCWRGMPSSGLMRLVVANAAFPKL